mgnify:CR=1 FL=1
MEASSKRRIVRGLMVGAGAALLVAGGSMGARALDPDFIDCFGLMIVDPTAHASQCLPSQVPIQFSSLSGLQGANAPSLVITTTITTTTTTTTTTTGST